jgi:hypothetical protein
VRAPAQERIRRNSEAIAASGPRGVARPRVRRCDILDMKILRFVDAYLGVS